MSGSSRCIYQVHVADGFADDCDDLMHRCSKYRRLTYLRFTEIWKELNMASIYQDRAVAAEIAELTEEILLIAKRYMLANTSNFEESVAGLFLVYALLNMQPFKRFAALRLVPKDVPAIIKIEATARREHRLDVLYILGSILIEGPVQFHAENREYGFDPSLRKYLEGGTTGIDRLGVRPRGVFFRHTDELDLIRELKTLTRLYEDSKGNIRDEHGQPDINLSYIDATLPTQLEDSLKKVINGVTDEDEGLKYPPRAEPVERKNLVRSIKARAMTTAIAPIRHLTSIAVSANAASSTAASATAESSTAASSTATSATVASSKAVSSTAGEEKTSKKKPSSRKTTKASKKEVDPRKKAETVLKVVNIKNFLKSGQSRSPRKQKPTKKAQSPKKSTRKRKKRDVSSSSEPSDVSLNLSEYEYDNQEGDDSDGNIDNQINGQPSNASDGTIDIDKLVEKQFNVHIDSMPIIITSNESQDLEIEFIDLAAKDKPEKQGKTKKVAKAKTVSKTKKIKNSKAKVTLFDGNNDGSSNTVVTKTYVKKSKRKTNSKDESNSMDVSNFDGISNSQVESISQVQSNSQVKLVTQVESSSSQVKSNSQVESNSRVDVDSNLSNKPEPTYRLRRREKRDLKKPVLKSKFKKMGLQDLILNKEDEIDNI